jgi:hypothetical protein
MSTIWDEILNRERRELEKAPRKPFSPEQYKQDDNPAKIIVANYIGRKWNKIVIEGEQYGADLKVIENDRIIGYIEIERRHNWIGEFPFDSVHVPERKKKFFELEYPTVLFALRSDLRQGLYCKGDEILNSPVEKRDNKHCSGELFFIVPRYQWILCTLQ